MTMKRIKQITEIVTDLVEENTQLKNEIKMMKAIQEIESNNGVEKLSKYGSDVEYLSSIGKKYLFDKFEEKVRYRGSLSINENGECLTPFVKWYSNVLEYSTDIYQYDVSNNFIDSILKPLVKPLYEQKVKEAKMEWVRSHKEGN